MAVTQISKIQHRRGKKDDLPSPSLSEGEFGYATDTGQLYIGAPNFPFTETREKEHPYKNIEILTELSKISRQSQVEYEFALSGDPTSTANWTQSRSLQSKLDDYVSVRDYGAVGDGETDDTTALLRAIVDVTREQLSSSQNGRMRALLFPAGIYKITRPLVIPPYSVWLGESASTETETFNNGLNSSGTVIKADFSDSLYEDYDAVVVSTDTSVTQLTDVSLIDQNNRNVGVDGNLPRDCFISNIVFQATNYTSRTNPGIHIMRLDRVEGVFFQNCKFIGEQECGDFTGPYNKIYNTNQESIAFIIDGFGDVIKPKDVYFQNCTVQKLNRVFVPTDSIKNIRFDQCIFEDLYKAFSIGEHDWDTGYSGGPPNIIQQDQTIENSSTNEITNPYGIVVSNSRFNHIFSHAFAVYSSKDSSSLKGSGNISAYNLYENVGNECIVWNNAQTEPLHSAVVFEEGSSLNQSVGDVFFYSGSNNEKRVSFDSKDSNLILNPQTFFSGSNDVIAPTQSFTLTDGSSDQETTIIFDPQVANNVIFYYSITRGQEVRTGRLMISVRPDGSLLNFNDSYTETDDVAFDLNAELNTNDNIVITYNDRNPQGADAELSWHAEKWKS